MWEVDSGRRWAVWTFGPNPSCFHTPTEWTMRWLSCCGLLCCVSVALLLPLTPGCAPDNTPDVRTAPAQENSTPSGTQAPEPGKSAAPVRPVLQSQKAVKPFDPRPDPAEKPQDKIPTAVQQVIALPPTPVPASVVDAAPLALPEQRLPKYPDGAWGFLSWSESFGLPLGVRKVEPGTKVLRDHVEIRVEGGRILSLHQINSQGRLAWVRDYIYDDSDLFPRGFTEKDERGTVVALGRYLDKSTRFAYVTPTGATLLDGCHELKRELDPSGFVRSQTCLSRNQTPIPDRNGVVSVQFERQEMGLATQRSHLGLDGNLTLDKNGVAVIQYEYNLDGGLTRMSFSGLDKKPVRHLRYGCSRVDFSYTGAGPVGAEKYYGIHDEPVPGALGVYGIRYAYDDLGRKTEETTIGIDGTPKPPIGARASRLTWDYDAEGRIARTQSFDPDGNPAPRGNGFHVERFDYPTAQEETVACFNVSLRPTACAHGTPSLRRERSAEGRVVAETFLDSDGAPVALKTAFSASSLTYEFDPEGRLRRQLWNDRNRQPIRTLGGPSALAFEYSEFGDIVLRSFQSQAGELLNTNWGYATVRSTFDDWGRLTQACVYSAAGLPVVANRPGSPFQGFHCLRFDYQGTWYPSVILFIDPLSLPVAIPWGKTGLTTHKAELQWDEHGRLLKITPAQPLPPPLPEAAAPGSPAPSPLPLPASAAPAALPSAPPLPPPPPMDCTKASCPDLLDLSKVLWP